MSHVEPPRSRSANPLRGTRTRPRLEVLEGRALLATVNEFPVPTAGGGPTRITAGPDGGLWFLEAGKNQLGRIDPMTHAITEFALPFSNLKALASGPDGNLWVTGSVVTTTTTYVDTCANCYPIIIPGLPIITPPGCPPLALPYRLQPRAAY
ncbi:MAG: hypothetical protein IRY99_04100 [Isosphaeraceae bacterium]|nr:hypothetical protein [Isosphaeraceae bacterium]